MDFDSELAFKFKVFNDLEGKELIGFSWLKIFDEDNSIKTGNNLIMIWPFAKKDYITPDYC